MEDFVIFSKPIIWILLSVIAAMYIIDVVINKLAFSFLAKAKEKEESGDNTQLESDYYPAPINVRRLNIFSTIAAAVNLALHLGEFACLLYIKATPEEILFLLMISIALALTASRIKKEV